jgi:hypothetical protein
MKIQKILVALMAVGCMTTFSIANEMNVVLPVVEQIEENDTWFGDAYEEDGCYCN